jgi:NTP pyrophosphatase (non-canonical NTP hydrolase)
MDFNELKIKALEIRGKYEELERKKYGRPWTREEIAMGLIGDIGDLFKFIMTLSGIRNKENAEDNLKHELSDILWSVIVLADKYGIDLEKEFINTMEELDEKISSQ